MVDNLGIALSVGLGLFATIILGVALKKQWDRRNDVPPHESFWWISGILFHWLATLNHQLLLIYNELHWIKIDTFHTLINLGKCMALCGGLFYFRALTLDRGKIIWPKMAALIAGIILCVYLFLEFK